MRHKQHARLKSYFDLEAEIEMFNRLNLERCVYI